MNTKCTNIFALILATTCTALGAHAETQRTIGDWTLVLAESFQETFTRNASGSTAGIWCSLETRDCFAYIRVDRNCEDGATVPVLANSAVGAAATESTCVKSAATKADKPISFNKINDFGLFRRAAESGDEFAFAIPLTGGQFSVSRFSSRGATQALKQTMTPPASTSGVKNNRPRDQVL